MGPIMTPGPIMPTVRIMGYIMRLIIIFAKYKVIHSYSYAYLFMWYYESMTYLKCCEYDFVFLRQKDNNGHPVLPRVKKVILQCVQYNGTIKNWIRIALMTAHFQEHNHYGNEYIPRSGTSPSTTAIRATYVLMKEMMSGRRAYKCRGNALNRGG